MLRKRVFQVAAAAAAALALGGCAPTVKSDFRYIQLRPVSQADAETVADLQVLSDKKVIGVAKGVVPKGAADKLDNLRVEALEKAIESAPSGADVLVAPSYFEVTENKVDVTVTVIGYPARYKNFRRDAAIAQKRTPFSVKQLPGGATVVSYDTKTFTASLAGDNVIRIKAVQEGSAAQQPAAAAAGAGDPAVTTPATEQAGEQ